MNEEIRSPCKQDRKSKHSEKSVKRHCLYMCVCVNLFLLHNNCVKVVNLQSTSWPASSVLEYLQCLLVSVGLNHSVKRFGACVEGFNTKIYLYYIHNYRYLIYININNSTEAQDTRWRRVLLTSYTLQLQTTVLIYIKNDF